MTTYEYFLGGNSGKSHLFSKLDNGHIIPLCGCPNSSNGSLQNSIGAVRSIDVMDEQVNVCKRGAAILANIRAAN